MTDFTQPVALPGAVVYSTALCIGSEILMGAGMPSELNEATWPTANTAIFLPMLVPRPFVFRQLAILNGSVVSGNIDMGIYDAGGNRLVSIGSTSQTPTDTTQVFNITDTPVNPGLYYLAAALSNTTGRVYRYTGGVVNVLNAAGVLAMASAFALPATATFSGSLPTAFVPFMLASGVATI